MPDIVLRLPALVTGCCFAAIVAIVDVSDARAAKLKMVFPGPVTTFSLPYLVAQKKGWMSELDVEDVHVTGDANAMRVLLSGNADIGLIGTLNVLASIHAGASIRAIHSWQPIGDYSLVLATGKGDKLADLVGKIFATSGPGGVAGSAAAAGHAQARHRRGDRTLRPGRRPCRPSAGGDRRPRRRHAGQHRHRAQGRAGRQGHGPDQAVQGISRARLCLERGPRRRDQQTASWPRRFRS